MIQLSNDKLKASFHTKGAELCSLKEHTGLEYIWQADPAIWGRHAPILFPIVGKVNNNTYRVDGKEYQLSQHGFARDREFEIIQLENDLVIFQLQADAQSLAVYPYQFELQIQYQLLDKTLQVSYLVKNKDQKAIYFSIGAHPGFTCPLRAGEQRTDYSLLFSKAETSERHLLENGVFNGKTSGVFQNENENVPLTSTIFDEDALVFKDLKSEAISIADAQGNQKVTVHFEGFPYMGIWSKSQTSPFVCIEPWCGIADSIDFKGDLSEKEGIEQLAVGETFKVSYSVEVH